MIIVVDNDINSNVGKADIIFRDYGDAYQWYLHNYKPIDLLILNYEPPLDPVQDDPMVSFIDDLLMYGEELPEFIVTYRDHKQSDQIDYINITPRMLKRVK